MFRLPEITYPLSIDTIGKMLALGHEMTANCLNTGCGQSSRINLVALGRRIGFDHPALHRIYSAISTVRNAAPPAATISASASSISR